MKPVLLEPPLCNKRRQHGEKPAHGWRRAVPALRDERKARTVRKIEHSQKLN